MNMYSRGIQCGAEPKKNPKEGKEGVTLAIVGGLLFLIFFTPLVKQK